MDYPSNVCVHGNGFAQIALAKGFRGSERETRIHVWHPALKELTQKVNTQIHNHRFGFVSTVMRGVAKHIEILPRFAQDCDIGDVYHQWRATGDRLPTGNRALERVSNQLWTLRRMSPVMIRPFGSYAMRPGDFHTTVSETPILVTLMTKTVVHPTEHLQASVFCRKGTEPDQDFDRFQIPWEDLRSMLRLALDGTPFEGEELWDE